MAKQTITMLTDDIDGGPADETITFGFEGALYEIDLSGKNAQQFREVMEKYTASGTRRGRLSPTGTYMPGSQPRRTGVDHPAFAGNKELNSRIREWAPRNGFRLAERGRIPQHIVDAYHNGIPAKAMPTDDALPTLGDADLVEQTDHEAAKHVINNGTPAKKVTRTRRRAS